MRVVRPHLPTPNPDPQYLDSESGPLKAVHLARHKWPGGLVNISCPPRPHDFGELHSGPATYGVSSAATYDVDLAEVVLEEEELLEREVAVEAHVEVSSKLGTLKTVTYHIVTQDSHI